MKPIFTSTQETGVVTGLFVQSQSQKIKALLDQARDYMVHTKDPSHGIDHLNQLLHNANRFFRSVGDTFNIDQDVLLLALYWHDVWKSQHQPTAWNYLFHQVYEGWGSMMMFRKHARKVGLPSRVTSAVCYAIRKHAAVQFHPARTLEAQLLWDVDTLDVWNLQRTKALFKNAGWANLTIFDSYILYMKKIGFPVNLEWTRNELKKIKPSFFKEMEKFRASLVNEVQGPQPVFIQSEAVSSKWNLNNKS